jgi:predicted amidohydrolase
MDPAADLVVAAAQVAESSAGLETVARLAGEAARHGADLIVFPEMSLHGYSIGADAIRSAACARDSSLLSAVAEIASGAEIAICVGYAELEPSTGAIYNAAALLDARGTLVHHYRKTHLYGDYEASVFTPGGVDELRVVALRPLREGRRPLFVGILICMDGEYPEPARILALRGANLVLLPTALGVGPVARVTPEAVVATRALENHVHVVYANYNGPAAASGYEAAYCGRSAIFGPDGVELARAPGLEAHHRGPKAHEALIVGAVEVAAFAADVARNPYLTARRPELYAHLCDAPDGVAAVQETRRGPPTRVRGRPTAPCPPERGAPPPSWRTTAMLMGSSATLGAVLASVWILWRRSR